MRKMKSLMLGGVGLIYIIASYTNYIDYNANFEWLKRVLTMRETFQNEKIMWRAITSEFWQKFIYHLILLWEFIVGISACGSSLLSLVSLNKKQRFDMVLEFGKWIVFASFVLHGYIFYAIGNEWFIGWQAQDLATKSAPLPFVIISGLTLLFLCMVDHEE